MSYETLGQEGWEHELNNWLGLAGKLWLESRWTRALKQKEKGVRVVLRSSPVENVKNLLKQLYDVYCLCTVSVPFKIKKKHK